MTWSNTITLWCDNEDCVEWERFEVRRVGSARSRAEDDGWGTTRGGPDYCPDCTEAEP